MGTRDPRIDQYIDRSLPFAQPILRHLREVVHAACPTVEETMKWSFPHFMYRGMLASMASFKQHCAFGLWKGSLVLEQGGDRARDAMGHFGRITSVDDLPADELLTSYIHKAMKLNEEGIKTPKSRKTGSDTPELAVPEALMDALRANDAALAAFQAFSPSHKREYAEWIADAKSDATRQRRIGQAVEWIAEGKSRNWKYERKS
jgi:uncharacterized protein YdeI (YjbR/CyaY-like superfamily)